MKRVKLKVVIEISSHVLLLVALLGHPPFHRSLLLKINQSGTVVSWATTKPTNQIQSLGLVHGESPEQEFTQALV